MNNLDFERFTKLIDLIHESKKVGYGSTFSDKHLKLSEETGEVAKEIYKYNINNMFEECADVICVALQLMYGHNTNPEDIYNQIIISINKIVNDKNR
jgi:NTP pyrophosphatase (non-canonical NTP hydrolase)